MFTINIYLRFALMAACLLGGIALWAAFGFWYALPFFLVGIVLTVGYVLFGTVQSAAMLLQNNDFVAAEKQLGLTFFPDWLYSANKSIYYMLKSTFAMNRRDTKESEVWLNKAQDLKLNSDNEKALVELQLAAIQTQRGNFTGAKIHLKKLKELKITEPALKEQVQQFEKAMQQSGQQKHGLMMRGEGHKGFRRPKMR